MRYKKFGNKYVIRIEKDEEVIASLKKFCTENNVKAGSISGIGATNDVTIAHLNEATKKFTPKQFKGDFEIAPLNGNIATINGEVALHIHINFGDKNYQSFAGHLNAAIISITCEIIIDVFEGEIQKKFDEETGLNLMDL